MVDQKKMGKTYIFNEVKFNQAELNDAPRTYFSEIYRQLKRENQGKVTILYHQKVHIYTSISFRLLDNCQMYIKWLNRYQDKPCGIYVVPQHVGYNIPETNSDYVTKVGNVLAYDDWYLDGLTLVMSPTKSVKQPGRIHRLTIGAWFNEPYPDVSPHMFRGNDGVIIEETEEDVYLLHFSSREHEFGDTTFRDLEIELKLSVNYRIEFACSDFSLWEKYRDLDIKEAD